MTASGQRRANQPTTFQDLDQRRRREVVLLAAARGAATITAILGVYLLVPITGFNNSMPVAAWVRLIAIILIFLVAMVLQVQLIITAHVPQVRAAEAVVVSVVLFLCLFSLLYASIAVTDPASFSEDLDRVDALYFTTATFATVGFGDVVPASSLARVAVTIQMIGGLGLLVMIAKVVFYAARQGLGRRP